MESFWSCRGFLDIWEDACGDRYVRLPRAVTFSRRRGETAYCVLRIAKCWLLAVGASAQKGGWGRRGESTPSLRQEEEMRTLVTLVILIFAVSCLGDTVTLRSGKVVECTVIEIQQDWVRVRLPSGKKARIRRDAIKDLRRAVQSQTRPLAERRQARSGYLQGRLDGERDAKGNPAWILAGLAGTGLCLCIGCAGVGLAYSTPPSPSPGVLMGKSSEYVMGYTEGYKSKARLENTKYAAAGCCMAAAINLIINVATGQLDRLLSELE